MKKYFIFAASALALASCQSDEFLGEVPGNVKEGASREINFNHNLGTVTRAGSVINGKNAADLLKKFYILGTKGELPADALTSTKVFDNYVVEWRENSAGTSEDNTDDWKYVGVTKRSDNSISEQSVKYWDYTADQYDFIAYSIGDNTLVTNSETNVTSGNVYGSLIETPKNDNSYKAFSVKVADVADLKKCYITDVVTVESSNYGNPVNLVFKNLSAKVRMAFYETVPGYTVKDIKFYTDATTTLGSVSNTTATLFASSSALPIAGTIDVKYPTVGSDNKSAAAYNKAYVGVTPTTNSTKLELGTQNYASGDVLATTAKEACMAGNTSDSYFTHVFPCPTGQALTLRVDYTLTSTDGSNETIKVYGATAVIPATYTAWQPNYAYTYIFKISDNTNGYTSTTGDKSGLFPITFDAVVKAVDAADFNQETITTVSAPSVTTYAFNTSTNKVIAAYNATGSEYPASPNTVIYFSVSELDGSNVGQPKTDLNTNGQLYSVSVESGLTLANVTEAMVIDALQIEAGTGSADVNGRNGVNLTKVTTECLSASEKVPTEDGKGIIVTANSVAKFTANTTPTTYAYVYKKSDGTPSYIYTAVNGNGTTQAGEDEYYEDPNGDTVVSSGTTLDSGKVYYKKYKNNNNVYGVKVVRTF